MSIYIIGEIGINHNSDMNLCKELITIAKDSGCNAVKFQKRDIDLVYTKEYLNSARESPWGNTQRDQKEGLEFSYDQYKEIDIFCKNLKIDWFASAWDKNSQKFLQQFDLPHNKIASAMIISKDFLELVAKEGKHTFISTGMSTYEDINQAVEIFRKHKCPFELMHTVSTYPMKDSDANLMVIRTLKKRYGCNVGYSGHEPGVAISVGAAALGITSLERHITVDRSSYGSDQAASLEPQGLRNLVGSVRKLELAMGDGKKVIIKEEEVIAKKLRAHL
ncbi:N-acetylneuraminate synthase [bacterium]|nr:N-acetylneuraminate synthase [bacterium]